MPCSPPLMTGLPCFLPHKSGTFILSLVIPVSLYHFWCVNISGAFYGLRRAALYRTRLFHEDLKNVQSSVSDNLSSVVICGNKFNRSLEREMV
jgi:hypothetical protein